MPFRHVPVMLEEAVHHLKCRPGGTYVDGTLGGSGHARKILGQIGPDGLLIGIDQDADAIHNAAASVRGPHANVHLVHDNFAHLQAILLRLQVDTVDGILLDLGLSLHQLEGSGRGFSFQKDEPLDMRMNPAAATTAEALVNRLPESDLAEIFHTFGEERWSRRIARSIVAKRGHQPIRTSLQLAHIVRGAVPAGANRHQRIHPATRVFMALRIAVNRELERIDGFMKTVSDRLRPGGRLCVISFHSLEDRIVKHGIREGQGICRCPPDLPLCVCDRKTTLKAVVSGAIRPTPAEIAQNPMARSARLRVAEKV